MTPREEKVDQKDVCDEKYVKKSSLIKNIIAFTGVLLTVIIISLGWAMRTNTNISILELKQTTVQEQLYIIQKDQRTNSDKLDIIINKLINEENKK